MRNRRRNFCGTPEGYENHLRHAERPCGGCLVGSATYTDVEIARQIEAFRERRRDRLLWENCGILRTTYEQIFEAQGRVCGCCKASDPKQGWHIDLDRTGAIRGILCSDCNVGIERLGDDLKGLQSAVMYLQAHTKRGGHPRHHGPADVMIRPAPSKCMETCFQHFDRGLSVNEVIVREKLSPDVTREIHGVWKERHAAQMRGEDT